MMEGRLAPDHVHMLASIPPKIGASSFMGCLKGKSAAPHVRQAGQPEMQVREQEVLGGGCCVSAVGLNEATIAECIQEQEQADTA